MPSTVALTVTRYRPEEESEPTFQTYEVPFRKDWVILDALNHVKDNLDGSLSFRWSCRMGVCGSCGMKVNGTPKLTCATFLSDYLPGPIRVEPLDYFPVVRDLVVDLTDFMRKLKQVKPWIIRNEEKPLSEGEYLQTPDQVDTYKQFSMCINGMLCYSVFTCHKLFHYHQKAQSPREDTDALTLPWPRRYSRHGLVPVLARVSHHMERISCTLALS